MKRFLLIALAVCICITSFGCASDKGSANGDSSNIPSESEIRPDTSAAQKETEKVPEKPITSGWKEIDGERYLDISSVKISQDADASSLFLTEFEGEEVKGYYIEEGIYSVDAKTMHRLVKMPFKGDGAIKYLNFTPTGGNRPEENFDGILYISRMDDPLYVFTCLPNEQSFYMQDRGRLNASVLYYPERKHDKIIPIGAAYVNNDLDVPDDTPITVCLGNMVCALKWKGEDWKIATEGLPQKPSTLYYLPWTLENVLGTEKLDPSKVAVVEDEHGEHIEISLTMGELKHGDSTDPRVEGMTFHFWGEKQFYFLEHDQKGSNLEGVAVSFEIWVKEPECSGYLTAAIGADLRDESNKIEQVFTGIGYAITSEPRVVFGHNVPPAVYDEIMQTELVQELLGITE